MRTLDKQRSEIIIPPRLVTLLALQFWFVVAFDHAHAACVWDYLHDDFPFGITTFDKSDGLAISDGLIQGLCCSLQYSWPS